MQNTDTNPNFIEARTEAGTEAINGFDMYFEARGGDWVHVFDLGEPGGRARLIVPDARGPHHRAHADRPGRSRPLYPVELSVEMYRAIPRARLWVVPGGGHAPIFAPDVKDRFARDATAFLEAETGAVG